MRVEVKNSCSLLSSIFFKDILKIYPPPLALETQYNIIEHSIPFHHHDDEDGMTTGHHYHYLYALLPLERRLAP
jgi:hypothetical protein